MIAALFAAMHKIRSDEPNGELVRSLSSYREAHL